MQIAFPGLTANFDLARQAALALAALDLIEHGAAYADRQIANAQALAAALAERDVAVLEVPGKGATSSQHVALPTADPHGAARRLEAANVLVSEIGVPSGGALRLGTQELTRRGLEPDGTAAIAEVMARVLVRGEAPERGAARRDRATPAARERAALRPRRGLPPPAGARRRARAPAPRCRGTSRARRPAVIGASTEPRGWSTAAASVRPSAVRTATEPPKPFAISASGTAS